MRALRIAIVIIVCLASFRARASDKQTERARALYSDGRVAFDAEKYQVAYDAFHEAYALSPSPALLYNMAVSLEALGRPGDAAESFRAYLRAAPDERDRAAIAARTRSLDVAQQQLELEKLKTARPRLLELDAVEQRGKKRGLAIGLGVAGGVVLGLAIGLGLYFGLPARYPDSALGTQRATP